MPNSSEMREKLRIFHEQMDKRSGHAWRYWDKLPPIRTAEYITNLTKDVILCITDGKGDLRLKCLDLAFVAFAISEKGPAIQEVSYKVKQALVQESETSDDAEAEAKEKQDWLDKRKETKGKESWRG